MLNIQYNKEYFLYNNNRTSKISITRPETRRRLYIETIVMNFLFPY